MKSSWLDRAPRLEGEMGLMNSKINVNTDATIKHPEVPSAQRRYGGHREQESRPQEQNGEQGPPGMRVLEKGGAGGGEGGK